MKDQPLHELSHQADLAAYSVLGMARVLFLLVSDEYLKKAGLEAIAIYDRHRKACDDAQKALRTVPGPKEIAEHMRNRGEL